MNEVAKAKIANPSAANAGSYDLDEVFAYFAPASTLADLVPGDTVEFSITEVTNPYNTKMVKGFKIELLEGTASGTCQFQTAMTAWPTDCGISEISRADGPDYIAPRAWHTTSTTYCAFDLVVGKNIQKKDPAKYKFIIS